MATEDYGIDVDCVSDFKPHMPSVSGRIALAQALARRLQTPRGIWAIIGMPEYGTDIRQYLLGSRDLDEIAAAVVRECEKDERVSSVEATVMQSETSVTINVEVTPDTETDPFEFVFVVTADKAELLLTS